MTSNEELQGPDLTNGVSRDQLEEGKPIVGHAHGEPVMLVKSDGEVFATGASCTHYGGPLGDGVVSGKRVRCPWHHATFDLTTGDATAPAHDPIGCFEVIEENGKVAVGERRTRRDPKPKLQPGRVVIIGAGAAGSSCAETLRRRGYEGKLTIVAGDAAFPVDRPNLSKDYLAGDAPQEWLPVHDDAFFDEHDIDFVQKFATRIDRDARQVQLDDGSSLGFDALVIATGAAPRTLDVPGADGSGVHQLRTLEDANAIIADAEGAERAAIVGGSFIGLEAAASLRSRGLEVTVIDPQATPLQHVLGPELGRAV